MSLTLKRRVTVLVVILLGSLFFLNLSEASAFDRTEPPTYYGDPPPELLDFHPDLTNLPTAPPTQKFGIAAHPWWLDMFLDQFIAYYKDLKITTVRLPVEWKTLEPQPGSYDWTLNDRLLNRLQAEGFEIVAEFVTMPPWASLNPEECAKSDLACQPDPQALPQMAAMSAALVKHYPFIRYWEFWNEPDEWPNMGKNHIEIYGSYLKTFYDAVKKVDPTLQVAATSLTGPDYVDWLYNHCDTVYGYRPFDAIAYHPYLDTLPDPTQDAPFSGIRKNRIDQLRALMVARGDGNKPIWLTEVGWQDTPEKQSLFLKDTFDWVARRPYITLVHLHMLHDWDAELYGLVKPKEKIYWTRPLNKDDTFEPKQPYYDTYKNYDKRPLPPQPAPGPNLLVFPQTGHTVRDVFKRAWEQGGLELFGYPVTGQFYEKNPADSHYYLVQYFERVRMEYHPENLGTPYEVLFGLLGKQVLTSKGWFTPAGDPVAHQTEPESSPANSDASATYFPETGHSLSGPFLAEWQKEGGLKIIGLPISRVFDETNPETDEIYTVQYFERARAELHPGTDTQPAYVAFGLLGNEVLRDQNRLLENNRLNTENYYNPPLPEFKTVD